MKRLGIVGGLAFAGLLGYAMTVWSQPRDEGDRPPRERRGPRDGEDRPPPPRPPQLGKLLPPHIVDALKLTAEQKKQLTELEKETKAKLEKLLTADQKKELEKMRRNPPRGPRRGPPPRDGGPRGDRPPPRDEGPKERPKKNDD
jgi:hypothetical protein